MVFAFLSALGFTLYFTFIKRGLLASTAGEAPLDIQLVTTPVSLFVYFIGLITAVIFGFQVFEEFYSLTIISVMLLITEGFLGPLLGLFFTNMAIYYIGSSRASALRGSNPLFATILSILLLHEKPGLYGVLAVVLLIAGVVLVSYSGNVGSIDSKSNLKGIIYAILAALAFSLSQVIRGIALNYGATPNTAIAIGLITAVIAVYLIAIYKNKSVNVISNICSINRYSLYNYMVAGACVMLASYFLLVSFTHIPVWLAVAIRNTQPLLAIIVSWLVLKKSESINYKLVIGALLIVISIWIMLRV